MLSNFSLKSVQKKPQFKLDNIIIQIYANRIQVKFARPYQNRLTTFHFLDEERREADDVEIVQFASVKKNYTIPQN